MTGGGLGGFTELQRLCWFLRRYDGVTGATRWDACEASASAEDWAAFVAAGQPRDPEGEQLRR